ncbi:hypothetical protein ASE23_06820 [Rhizobium sp. Root73]|uniref:hypothetical protein n=1 Tax=unclassified Rhizobium TaxID=2613769 RepID=UPI0007132385|nr:MULTISPECIES: hypothetical protein [unclassified Rhizobium]KQV31205.1 hypothetical protein ASC96_08430 [Rhizobium sp. Root1204]KQY10848.1 hypothetical protein ASD36_09055 [Rhizobium sp. Root1334]KRC04833.1 hypothetical protein ASE23_06820 [Rhizobium sp. Root73]
MPVKSFTADAEWNVGLQGQTDAGYRTLSYSGSLGGGTLQILSQVSDGDKTALPDTKLTVAKVDSNGDIIRQLVFRTSGNIFVTLTGSTAPTAKVSVQ